MYNELIYEEYFDKEINEVNPLILNSHEAYMDFHRFAYIHMATGCLDPVYSMIRYSDLSQMDKLKLMFSHLMVYDLKSSIHLAGVPDSDYYDELKNLWTQKKTGQDRRDVAERETNPNSRMCGTQIPKMRAKAPHEWMEEALNNTLTKPNDWLNSVKAGQEIPTFGEYFGFKTADMIETIFNLNHSIIWNEGFRKTIPRGSLTGYECVRVGRTHKFRDKKEIKDDIMMQEFYHNELKWFKDFQNPHKPTRGLTVQEIETLLCDYRKMRKGTLKHGDKTQKLLTGLNANTNHIAAGLKNIVHAMVSQKDKVMVELVDLTIDKDSAIEHAKFLLQFEGKV